jgi:hypothetical protein
MLVVRALTWQVEPGGGLTLTAGNQVVSRVLKCAYPFGVAKVDEKWCAGDGIREVTLRIENCRISHASWIRIGVVSEGFEAMEDHMRTSFDCKGVWALGCNGELWAGDINDSDGDGDGEGDGAGIDENGDVDGQQSHHHRGFNRNWAYWRESASLLTVRVDMGDDTELGESGAYSRRIAFIRNGEQMCSLGGIPETVTLAVSVGCGCPKISIL